MSRSWEWRWARAPGTWLDVVELLFEAIVDVGTLGGSVSSDGFPSLMVVSDFLILLLFEGYEILRGVVIDDLFSYWAFVCVMNCLFGVIFLSLPFL